MRIDHVLAMRTPLRDLEHQLIRLSLESPGAFPKEFVSDLRYIISFARLLTIQNIDGDDIDLSEYLSRHRWWVTHQLRPRLLGENPAAELRSIFDQLRSETIHMRDKVLSSLPIDRESLEDEVTQRQLVVVSGGGGGGGYGYAGAFLMLHRHNIEPQLLAGTSIGALVSMFRARHRVFDQLPMIESSRRLKWNTVFRILETENRYGVPATLRLYLRSALGTLFQTPLGRSITFADCEIPLLIMTTGLTVDAFKHDMDYYEHFMDDAVRPGLGFRLSRLRSMAKLITIFQEFYKNPDAMREVVFGADASTMEADVLDAAGFSSAVPGLIHYDVLRNDPKMTLLLDGLYAEKGITRLSEGGLVNNLPARPAFEQVMQGRIGRRNPFVLAMDCFSPMASSFLWYPVQQFAQMNVRQNLPYVDFCLALTKRLPAINVVPKVNQMTRAMKWTMDELRPHMSFIKAACSGHEVLK